MTRKLNLTKMFSVLLIVAANLVNPVASHATTVSPIAQVDTSCIVLQDGNLDCWALGATNGFRSTQPQVWMNAPMRAMQMPKPVLQASNNCYILSDSTVWCANDSTLVPVGISATSISKGDEYNIGSTACAVTTATDVVCWNIDGGTGNPTTPQAVGITGATQVEVGISGSGCALLATGAVQCWGWLASAANSATPTTMTINPGHLATSIAAAWGTACAITDDKTVWCWGDNSKGQTAQAIPANSSASLVFQVPTKISNLSNVKQISLGQDPWGSWGNQPYGVDSNACALDMAGAVYCWGTSPRGAVGTTAAAPTITPTLVPMPTGLSANLIDTNNMQSCAATSDGSLYCWGSMGIQGCNQDPCNQPVLEAAAADIPDAPFAPTLLTTAYSGGLASATWQPTTDASSPALIGYQMSARFSGATSTIVEMATTSWSRCAVLSDGTVACWGDNFWYGFTPVGKFGTSATRYSNTPVLVPGITNAVQVAIGIDFACALLADSSVTCWGLNNYGQLGRGSSAGNNDYTRNTPAPVVGLPGDITQISAREGGICALSKTAGTVLCWGNTARGNFSTPTAVPGIAGATKLSYGNDWACVVINDGSVQCWGHNAVGTFGDGTADYSNTPTTVAGLSRVADVYALDQGACALQVDGYVLCWGRNSENQLGNGNTSDSMAPQLVTGIPRATTLGGSEHGMCIADAAIQVFCWGKPGIDYPNPTRVPGLDNSVAFSGGFYTMCGVTQSGTAGCIGDNTAGEMGSGSYKDMGNFTLMTNDVISMCETTSTACSVPSPPGATSVAISVQAFNANGVSYTSGEQTIGIVAPNAVTQINNTALSAATNQSITVQAVSTSATASFSYATPTPTCAIAGNQVSAATPSICEVVATSTTPLPAAGINSGTTVPTGKIVAQNTSHSTKVKFIFVGNSQATGFAVTTPSNNASSAITLTSSGGSGTGAVTYFSATPGCHITGNQLSVAGSAQQACVVQAKKEGDSTYDSSLSSLATINLNVLVAGTAQFSTAVRISDGFSVNVTNYDSTRNYSATTNAGKVRVGRPIRGQLPITVSNLAPGQLAKITLTSSAPSTPNDVSTFVSGSQARKIKLGKPTSIINGFTVAASTLDTANFNYVPHITGGDATATFAVAGASAGLVTVSNLSSVSAEVTLTQVPKQPNADLPNAYWSDSAFDISASAAPLPTVSNVATSPLQLGDFITVIGTHLWQTTSVSVNGVKAPRFTVLTDQVLQVPVWQGARPGAISVTTATGTATGGNFGLLPGAIKPVISALSSTSVGVGESLQVDGLGLGSARAVYLGVTPVTFHTSDSTLMVDVPTGIRAGKYNLQIVTATGSVRSALITLRSAPVVPAITTSYNVRAGQLMFLLGTNLGSATSLTINGVAFKPWAVYRSGIISVALPSNLRVGDNLTVVVTSAGGISTPQVVTVTN